MPNPGENTRNNYERTLNLDGILTTQPELGPSIPDGGYGWLVFLATLFFQAVIPSLIINFGIFLAFAKLENGTAYDSNPYIWDEKLLYVPLFYLSSRTIFDSTTRTLVTNSTWPRLVATGGICLTCAGLLFMWMGMTGLHDDWLFVVAGILSGFGASLVMVQCEMLLTQYFRIKLPILIHISQDVAALGFLLAPVILGHYILSTTISHVLLWYQAIILQGLIISIIFKKPLYLKSRFQKPYRFVSNNADDEEDIFSKNSRELQIKRQTSTETEVKRIEIEEEPTASTSNSTSRPTDWEKFDDDEEDIKYNKLEQWETFDEEVQRKHHENNNEEQDNGKRQNKKWENFDDEPPSPRIINNMSLAEETNNQQIAPSPLFGDTPVNNNTTYAYDDEIVVEQRNSNVFMSDSGHNRGLAISRYWDSLQKPTFYKSLLMVITDKYSEFVFYSLFPSYLFIEVESINIRHMASLVGALTLTTLLFLPISYWINIDKRKRPVILWVFCWIGCVGYFMISDSSHEYALLAGAVQIILSINALQHFGKPLLRISLKGEVNEEYGLLTALGGLALLLILVRNASFKDCFRLMAILHFFTGTLWLANYIYKKIRIT